MNWGWLDSVVTVVCTAAVIITIVGILPYVLGIVHMLVTVDIGNMDTIEIANRTAYAVVGIVLVLVPTSVGGAILFVILESINE